MASLLYYIPGRQHIRLPEVASVGLGYAFEQDCTPCQVLEHGPDGGAGVICADSTRVQPVKNYPNRQQWQKIPGNPAGAWVGRYTDQQVRPEDVQRLETLPGHNVRLADGLEWLVPVARGIAAEDGQVGGWYVALPQRISQDDEGHWTRGEVCERYIGLWNLACQWWDQIQAEIAEGQESGVSGQESEGGFDFDRLHNAAAEVLAINYRLSPAEMGFLGLFEDGTARAVMMATVDWPTIERLAARAESAEDAEKKTQPDEISAVAG